MGGETELLMQPEILKKGRILIACQKTVEV
jgi:hypothetical protein